MSGIIEVPCKILMVNGVLIALGIFFKFNCTIVSLCFQKYPVLSFKKVSRDKIDPNFSNISSHSLPTNMKIPKTMLWGKLLQSGALQEKFSRVPNCTVLPSTSFSSTFKSCYNSFL